MADRPRILMASYFDWGSPLHLGSHNLAAAFVDAGWEVAFVSTAISLAHAARDWPDFTAKAARYSFGGRRWLDERLWAYMPFALLTPHNVPLLRTRLMHRRWQLLTTRTSCEPSDRTGSVTLTCCTLTGPCRRSGSTPSGIVRRSLGSRTAIPVTWALRPCCVSWNRSSFGPWTWWHTQASASRRSCAHKARSGCCTCPMVSTSHTSGTVTAVSPRTTPGIPHPIAVYVGSLDEWFDYGMVNTAAASLPDVSFVIIGPAQHARDKLHRSANMHVLGPRPFSELPRYLHNADVGLLPRDARSRGELVHAMHPLKLYGYMACGLPVVATRLDELERLDSPATLCVDDDSFVTAIRSALTDPPDPSAALAFANQADWALRVKALLQALPEVGPCIALPGKSWDVRGRRELARQADWAERVRQLIDWLGMSLLSDDK